MDNSRKQNKTHSISSHTQWLKNLSRQGQHACTLMPSCITIIQSIGIIASPHLPHILESLFFKGPDRSGQSQKITYPAILCKTGCP